MDFDMIFKRFAELGELDGEQADRWKYLVYESMYDISEMLIPDCDSERFRHRLASVAAALAFYRYRKILCARGQLTGIKAGDLTVGADRDSVEYAYSLYCDALSTVRDLIVCDDMIFGRVESFVQRRNFSFD